MKLLNGWVQTLMVRDVHCDTDYVEKCPCCGKELDSDGDNKMSIIKVDKRYEKKEDQDSKILCEECGNDSFRAYSGESSMLLSNESINDIMFYYTKCGRNWLVELR